MSSIYEEKAKISEEYIRLSQYFYNNNVSYASEFLNLWDVNYAIPLSSIVRHHNPNLLGFTPLHFAVKDFRFDLTNLLLNHGADVTIKNFCGFTPLHLSIEKSQIKFEKSLLNLKGIVKHRLADALLLQHVETKNIVNPCCNNGISHFHIACMINNCSAVQFFLTSGINVNDPVNIYSPHLAGYTPLHIAARYSCVEVAQLLLHNEANVNSKNANGITPLYLLIQRNLDIADFLISIELDSYQHSTLITEQNRNEKIIELLMDKINEIDDLGLSKVHIACTIKNTSIIKNLFKKNVDLNTTVNISSPFWSGYTPLHFASHFNIEIVKLLLKKEASIIVKDTNGITALDICMEKYEAKDVHSIFILLSQKNFENVRFSDDTKLIDFIFSMQDHKSFSNFLKCKSNIIIPLNSAIWPGSTPSHIAVIYSNKIANHVKIYGEVEYSLHYNFNHTRMNQVQNLVKTCLHRDDDFNTQDLNGLTPLHLALKLKKFNILQAIIKCPREKILNLTDNDNVSFLHLACSYNNEKLVKALLCQSTEINCQMKTGKVIRDDIFVKAGSTALHISVIFGYAELIKMLLQHGADPMIKDSDGLTPIHLSIGNPNASLIINDILSTSPSKIMNSTTDAGLSHFQLACYVNHIHTIESLFKFNKKEIGKSYICKTKKLALQVPSSIEEISGGTPLHFAVNGSAVETIDFLIKQGANIHAKNEIGMSPLHVALMKDDDNSEKILNIFLSKLEINKKECIDDTGLNRLHIACKIFDKIAVDNIIRSSADVNACINSKSPIWPGDTPLHILMAHMKRSSKSYDEILDIVDLLLKSGADVTVRNKTNLTPLRIAQGESISITKTLLQNSTIFNSNPIDNEGFSHFHMACLYGDANVVKEFLKRGVDVNSSKDFFTAKYAGYSPLHFAIHNDSNCKEIINELIKYGTNFNAANTKGLLPIHTLVKFFSSDTERLTFFFNLQEVDINSTSVFGFTPLQLYLEERFLRTEVIKLFLMKKARVNLFNPVPYAGYKEGCMAKILNHDADLFFDIILNHAVDLNFINCDCSNSVHNIVSINRTTINDEVYTVAIFNLLKSGCEIDLQDVTGKTPLHVACEFRNDTGIIGLLNNGVDINITNDCGNSALYDFPTDDDFLYRTTVAIKYFKHLTKLVHFGIQLNEQNENCYQQMLSNHVFRLNVDLTTYNSQLDLMKDIVLYKNYKLRNFLSENLFRKYESLSFAEREVVKKILDSTSLIHEFSEINCLLQLQYRKPILRAHLVDKAKPAMLQLGLPDLCISKILKFLRNDDLKNLASMQPEAADNNSQNKSKT